VNMASVDCELPAIALSRSTRAPLFIANVRFVIRTKTLHTNGYDRRRPAEHSYELTVKHKRSKGTH